MCGVGSIEHKSANIDKNRCRMSLNYIGQTNSKIRKIGDVEMDTYANSNLFFSHRRATHKSPQTKIKTGRQISVIGIIRQYLNATFNYIFRITDFD